MSTSPACGTGSATVVTRTSRGPCNTAACMGPSLPLGRGQSWRVLWGPILPACATAEPHVPHTDAPETCLEPHCEQDSKSKTRTSMAIAHIHGVYPRHTCVI